MGEDMLKIGIFSCSHLFDFVSMALLKLFKRVSCYILLNEGVSIGNCYKFHLLYSFLTGILFLRTSKFSYISKKEAKKTLLKQFILKRLAKSCYCD